MHISVIGTGHVGLVTAAALASDGHQVVGMDDDRRKIELLRDGRMPFFEPGMEELVREQVSAGRLRFTCDLDEAVAEALVVFVCVGTPPLPGGGPDLHLARALIEEGAQVRLFDPVALPAVEATDAVPGAQLVDDAEKALDGAHAAIVATEWDEVRQVSPERFKELLAYPIVVDARNALDPDAMRAAGLHYYGVGLP
jgi:UDP-glucose 6-dehydrogenase